MQEFVGSYASSTFTITILNPTTLRVPASPANGQVSIAINGRWRYVTTNVDSAPPSGLAVGENPVFVAASDNLFATNASPPPREIDSTDYTFRLIVKPAGQTPSGTGVETHYRQVGVVTWDGAKFTSIRQTVGGMLDQTQVNLSGTLANRPAATTGNAGYTYFATDVNGGTEYRSIGGAWTQTSKGVTETGTPVTHASTHLQAGSDALAWTTIHGYGTLAARPAPAASNNGYTYLATDVAGGSLYESNGSAWLAASAPSVTPNVHAASHLAGGTDSIAWTTILGSGTLAARPAAAATNLGYRYVATDTGGGTLYQSNGSIWTQIAANVNSQSDARTPVAHASSHLANAADAISWGTVHGRGTLAARPAAGPTNANYFYVAYDAGGGTTYHSDGSTWFQVASNVNAQSDARPPTGPAGGVLQGTYPNPSGLAANTVGGAQIVDGSVATAELADGAATKAKQADGSYPVAGLAWPDLGAKIDGKPGKVYLANGDSIGVTYDSNQGRWVSEPFTSSAGVTLLAYNGTAYAFGPVFMFDKLWYYNAGFSLQVKGVGFINTDDPDAGLGSSAVLEVYIYEAGQGNDQIQYITNFTVATWQTSGWSNFGRNGYFNVGQASGREYFYLGPRVTGYWYAGGSHNITAHVTMMCRWVA